MDPNSLLATLSIWTLVKVFFLVGLAVYVGFAAVMVRQVGLMRDTVRLGLEGPIALVAWTHLFFAIGLFSLALILL